MTRGVRVATANAASGRGPGGVVDLEAFTTDAAALDVDLLAVQEVDHRLERSGGRDQATDLARGLAADGPPWSWRFAAAVRGTPGRRGDFGPALGDEVEAGLPSYGVALVSRHPVVAWRELRVGPSRAALPFPDPAGGVQWVPDEPRVALAAEVAAPRGRLTVVCTHLSFAPPRAAAQLRAVVRWAATLPRPLLLLGDLNLPGRWPARLTGWEPVAEAPTYPRSHPRLQLDHVLLDAGPTSTRAAFRGCAALGRSDHLAVLADVVLDPAGPSAG